MIKKNNNGEKLMLKKFTPVLLALAALLTACGPQGTPTMSAADVQGTAVSSAWTMVAMTQAAIPTNTPTEVSSPTPLATLTPIPSPTLDVGLTTLTPTLAPTTAASGDPCNKSLVVSSGARMTRLRLQNETGSPVTLSIYLNKTPFGDCGYRGYTLSKGSRDFVEFPQGCYYFFAIINNPKNPSKSFGGGDNICANNDDLWVVKIGKDIINLASP
jgi:hypothetical protein